MRQLYLSFCLLLVALTASAQTACSLTNLHVVPGDCIDGHFYGTLNFDHSGATSDSFRLRVNNVVIGVFAYSALPLTVGPYAGNGTTVNHFLVRDKATETCVAEFDLEAVDCDETSDCSIYDMTYELTQCVDNHFLVILDFEYSNPVSDYFKVQGNGQQYGSFSYTALPIILGPFAANGTTVYEFVAKDLGNLECTDFVVVGPVDCEVPTTDLATPEIKLVGAGNTVALEGIVPLYAQWFDMLGQQMQPRSITPNTWQFDAQPAGMYVLVFIDAQGRRLVQRWVK